MPNAIRSVGQGMILVLSLSVVAYAVVAYSLFALGTVVHPDMRAGFEAHRIAIYTHIFASAVALLLGPIQFSVRLRTARPGLHRWLGRTYLGLGLNKVVGPSAEYQGHVWLKRVVQGFQRAF